MDVMPIGKLTELAEKRGKTVQQLVVEAVEKRGSLLGAAKELDVSPNTIRYHLAQAGVKLTIEHTVKLEKVS